MKKIKLIVTNKTITNIKKDLFQFRKNGGDGSGIDSFLTIVLNAFDKSTDLKVLSVFIYDKQNGDPESRNMQEDKQNDSQFDLNDPKNFN